MNIIKHVEILNQALNGLDEKSSIIIQLTNSMTNYQGFGKMDFAAENVSIKSSHEGIEGTITGEAEKGKFQVKVHQLAKPSRQESIPFQKNDKWATAVGKIGSLSIKQTAEFKIIMLDKNKKFISIKPIEELKIRNETKMKEALRLISEDINKKAQNEDIPVEAEITSNPLDPDERLTLVIKGAKTGEEIHFTVTDAASEVAEKMGIKKNTNIHRYKKGQNCIYSIDGKKIENEANEAVINNGSAVLVFKETILTHATVSFVTEKNTIINPLEAYLSSLNEWVAFVKENRNYIRSDVLGIMERNIETRKTELSEIGIYSEEEMKIEYSAMGEAIENELEKVKDVLFDEKDGFITVFYLLASEIMNKPFGMFAKEDYNPFIQKLNPRFIKNIKL